MANQIYEYKVWCIEEGKYTYQHNTSTPIICTSTYSHTGAREIDTELTEIISTIGFQYPGYYQATTLEFTVPGGTGLQIVNTFADGKPIMFPMDIILWEVECFPRESMVGDSFSLIAAPDTPIGYLTTGAASGATTVYTQNSLFESEEIYNGVDITITDGVDVYDLGRLYNKNTPTGTISFENPLDKSYNPGSVIMMNIRTVKNMTIVNTSPKSIARKGLQGKKIPANTPSRLEYYNKSNLSKAFSKTFYVHVEYYYF